MELSGKRISILGDSLSTYAGVSNDASVNAALGVNACYYGEPFRLEDTWWQRIIDKYKMELCVNNSYSGGLLCGGENSGVKRAGRLATDGGKTPEIIIVFMGINDLACGISPAEFKNAYEKTLETIAKNYCGAEVFCVGLPDRKADLKALTEEFNGAIISAVQDAGNGVHYVDLFSSPLNNFCYMLNSFVDGLHLNASGMQMLSEAVEKALIAQSKKV